VFYLKHEQRYKFLLYPLLVVGLKADSADTAVGLSLVAYGERLTEVGSIASSIQCVAH